ncbi:nicotinate-nucleotide--dimethylbenzimidazole phosphoribosyltransferase [Edwardsiella piscicida]|uniref:nicotinate-nucleotide--dimethylbenzimidazole phosphoribosyltransferase n=1 Tax=Edwardsiella piscicida TaxID=1263550 RepID=UPI00084BF69B|nr:nicotinate-nucleotide--dimethylbenzimidazole phosphoribosyltransferase [Edwardsiella piscicida]AOP43116.1 nicotinate-nucleotide--dimethylbenzimidazole phosphoribosyltransferase [Edwardsiella piscicida]EKS7767090.1 nicotinate-nucleotide--dimethylbenzimidazole phosphoribosyltransferase [Edwardsiella piscicida]EKS7814077.1 nicotinate-nucleotide--dimethylbenzimidazole phosphoribosyltransferase [Edwardsiella piscicida]UCQ19588.1 nicotinate-nucleotide--dimethylbenzimidazole phosphoribosyltransfera
MTHYAQALAEIVAAIRPLDDAAQAQARQRQDSLLKPPGSLGRLEQLAVQLAGITAPRPPTVTKKQIFVIAADHGVYQEGVAISPQAVTAIQAHNMALGITGVCVLAQQAGAAVTLVDAGIDADPLPQAVNMRMGRGCGNIAHGPAMSRAQAEELLVRCARLAMAQAKAGVDLMGIGELGIANTTPAAALVSVLTGSAPAQTVGLGANLPADRLRHKVAVVEQAIRINAPDPQDGVATLAALGGFDLVGMAGVMIGAAAARVPLVLDGFLSYAAALAACRIAPGVHPYLIPSHHSAEKGAALALAALGLTPYLHMEMRLGEGSGAALMMPIVEAACAVHQRMGLLSQSNIVLP